MFISLRLYFLVLTAAMMGWEIWDIIFTLVLVLVSVLCIPNYNIYIQCCVSFYTQLILTKAEWIVYKTVCEIYKNN